jgi:hypothetical protein
MSADDVSTGLRWSFSVTHPSFKVEQTPDAMLAIHEFLTSEAQQPNVDHRVYSFGERVVQDPPSAMTEERAQAAQEAQEESGATQAERKRLSAEARERSQERHRVHTRRLNERWRRERQQREEEFRAFKKRGGWR